MEELKELVKDLREKAGQLYDDFDDTGKNYYIRCEFLKIAGKIDAFIEKSEGKKVETSKEQALILPDVSHRRELLIDVARLVSYATKGEIRITDKMIDNLPSISCG